MARLSVNLPPELHQRARIKAIQDGRALSDIVRGMLEAWTGEQGPPDQMAEYIEAAKADPQNPTYRRETPDSEWVKVEEVSVVEATPANVAAGTVPLRRSGPITKADQAKGKTRRK